LEGEGPLIDLAAEAELQRLLLQLARRHLLESAHDVSDGGLGAALAECCTAGAQSVGARIELDPEPSVADAVATLFGETPTLVVASVRAAAAEVVLERAREAGVPARSIGETGGDVLSIAIAPLERMAIPTEDLRARREACLRSIVGDWPPTPAPALRDAGTVVA
jgi:phosphoribosylformylglycinamidine synthase